MIITGYFSIGRTINWKRIVLLAAALFLYSWAVGLWALYIGEITKGRELVNAAFPIWRGGNWFVCCYLVFSCFIPLINAFAVRLTRRRYQYVLLLNYVMFLLIPYLSGNTYLSGPLIYFLVMYLLGGYVRLYGFHCGKLQSAAFWRRICAAGIFLIFIASLFPVLGGHWKPYWKIIQLIEPFMALGCFMIALLHKPFYSRRVNQMAASVLGIYLIHDNPLVRRWIWTEWHPNLEYLDLEWFPLFMVGKVLLVFLVCLGIDQLRLHFVEPRLKRYIDRHWAAWAAQTARYRELIFERYLDRI